ncbi:unnamed protein product [Cunninghamella blakesleeana]
MSWQNYVDSNLVGTGHVSQGAIIGAAGGVWAKSPNFNLTDSEVATLVKNYGDLPKFREEGIHLAGQKYITIKSEDRSVYGKKGADGVCCVKTGQAILIGVFKEGTQPGNCAKVVEGLADYLITSGY